MMLFGRCVLRIGSTWKTGFSRCCSSKGATMSVVSDSVLNGHDKTQVKLMEEKCILIDDQDKQIGSATKKECHLLENIRKGMLHRAFSVFLFNADGKLLLQQRSNEKITFPGHFTNTCCSHPLNTAKETVTHEALGVKSAAQRKLKHELGINPDQLSLKHLHYITRIQYQADNVPDNGLWGEHEIDYILIAQKDVDVHVNTNEVQSYRYVDQEELKKFMKNAKEEGILITPWFKLIVDTFLWEWWDNIENIDKFADHKNIHNLCDVTTQRNSNTV